MQKHFKQLIFKEEAIIARAVDVEISRVQFLSVFYNNNVIKVCE